MTLRVTPQEPPHPLAQNPPEAVEAPGLHWRLRAALWWLAGVAVLCVCVWVWLNDQITMQGERTIYTARCDGGEWAGNRCTGTLREGDRYRFRALKNRREVLFWVLGASSPSAKFTDCAIGDGRNWKCAPGADTPRTITREIASGEPVLDDSPFGLPFHGVSKWKWYLLKANLWPGRTADS